MYERIRQLLFRLDPERAHELVFALLRLWQGRLQSAPAPAPPPDPLLETRLFGLTFPNPVGLAAGFDKNGELPHVWRRLGFGFAELGTVTARAQPGNPQPRLFRLPADEAIINRMGFNNAGAEEVARALAARLAVGRPAMPIGINLGKSRAVAVEDAAADYAASLRLLFPLADYVAVNVSSPNTPGLRGLQSEAALEPLLREVQNENGRLAAQHRTDPRPVLVKVAPDLGDEDLAGVVAVARRAGVAGLIATNTTIARPPGRTPAPVAAEAGGLSGAPLRDRSTEVVRTLYRLSGGSLPIVGVGGIFGPEDAYEKIRAGASLVQVYTGFVYRGPRLPQTICDGLRARLRRDGFTGVAQAVGRGAAS